MPTIDITPSWVRGVNAASGFASGLNNQLNTNAELAQRQQRIDLEKQQADQAEAERQQQKAQEAALQQGLIAQSQNADISGILPKTSARGAAVLLQGAEKQKHRDMLLHDMNRLASTGFFADQMPDPANPTKVIKAENPERRAQLQALSDALKAGVDPSEVDQAYAQIKAPLIQQRAATLADQAHIARIDQQIAAADAAGVDTTEAHRLGETLKGNLDMLHDPKMRLAWMDALQGYRSIDGPDGKPLRVHVAEADDLERSFAAMRQENEQLKQALMQAQTNRQLVGAQADVIRAQAAQTAAERERVGQNKPPEPNAKYTDLLKDHRERVAEWNKNHKDGEEMPPELKLEGPALHTYLLNQLNDINSVPQSGRTKPSFANGLPYELVGGKAMEPTTPSVQDPSSVPQVPKMEAAPPVKIGGVAVDPKAIPAKGTPEWIDWLAQFPSKDAKEEALWLANFGPAGLEAKRNKVTYRGSGTKNENQ